MSMRLRILSGLLAGASLAAMAGLAQAQSNSPQNPGRNSPITAPQARPAPTPPQVTAPSVTASQTNAPSVTAAKPLPGSPTISFDEIVGVPYRREQYNLWAIGFGAVGGVMAVNALMPILGASTVAVLPTTTAGLETIIATAQTYSVVGAVSGGIIGQMIYDAWR